MKAWQADTSVYVVPVTKCCAVHIGLDGDRMLKGSIYSARTATVITVANYLGQLSYNLSRQEHRSND